jgi:hypothetical protein
MLREEYDGSAWTAGGNLGTARFTFMGCGTQTAGLGLEVLPILLLLELHLQKNMMVQHGQQEEV